MSRLPTFLRRLTVCCALIAIAPTPALAQGTLTASFDTTEVGGNYAPKNIVAVWIEDSNGGFVKTIGRWSATRTSHLVAWVAASGRDTDAVSGATRANHDQRLTVTWDLTDTTATAVADGDYVLRMELADRNSNSPADNNQGSFPFTIDGQDSSQSVAGGGFLNVAIDVAYAAPADCGNGVIDVGETCDPLGSCPTSCAPSADACVANTLVAAGTCAAECVESTITRCVDGDGCCADGCTADDDNDCTPSGNDNAPSTSQPISGGCAATATTNHGSALALLLLCTALLWRRRRPRCRDLRWQDTGADRGEVKPQ